MILILALGAFMTIVPSVSAHTPPWEIPTYAYVVAAPNPIGVNQDGFIVMWINRPAPTSTGVSGDRWGGYTLVITKPDGTKETKGPFTADSTSSTFYKYTPDQIGTYTIDFSWPGQVLSLTGATGIPGLNSPFINDTYLASSASTTLTVTEEQIAKIPDNPLPTSYWRYPIEGQNSNWASISSNWLGGAHLRGWASLWQQDGNAPNSGHILWTKPIELGGIVGGTTAIPGVGYYSGGSYEGRFDDTIIINGKLIFTLPLGHSDRGGGLICLDLYTGEEIWYRDDFGVNGTASPAKASLYEYESFNQHGVVGGALWVTIGSTWHAIDPFSGMWMYTLTNVPSGTEVYTENGEIVRYRMDYTHRWLALWNNSAEQQGLHNSLGTGTNAYQWRPNGKTVDMSNAYSWNVTIPDLPGSSNPSIVKVLPGDIILGRSSNIGLTSASRGTDDPYTMWALSDKPGSRGQLLWLKNYPAPSGNLTYMLAAQPVDIVNRVWTMTVQETGQRLGFSLDTGAPLWGPVGVPYQDPEGKAFQYYSGREGFPAYGNLYIGGYGGEILCYSMKNGSLLWKYDQTNSGLETPWGLYPTPIFAIADGKVFANSNEHSPNYPIYKGEKTHVIDAFTGELLWKMDASGGTSGGSRQPTSIVAGGTVVYYNYYDNQIYVIGKGPSAVTLTASPKTSTQGSGVLIEGIVTDQSEGAKELIQKGLFNVVPAISDESTSAWMEYLYMQKAMPVDDVGVNVKLTTIDPNGNTIEIGTVTSDNNGLFKKLWTPDIEGEYTVVATFEGSESYWPSSTETAVGVEAAPVVIEPTPTPASNTDTYIAGSTIAIVAAIAVVAFLLLRKK